MDSSLDSVYEKLKDARHMPRGERERERQTEKQTKCWNILVVTVYVSNNDYFYLGGPLKVVE